ncbi:MAG: isochorismatase family protein [Rhodanobacter sp.]|jgi:nicotinamidase-related amidase
MSVSTLDPHTALIVIDLQNGIVAYPAAHPTAEVVARASALACAFRQHQLPVVLVNVTGFAPGRNEQARRVGDLPADWAELVPELNRQPDDHAVSKQSWGAFTGTDLLTHLQKNRVTQVVVAGVATSIGVESTARQAHELGFNVTLAIDAMTDMSADAHANSVERIFPRLGETGTTAEIIALLERSVATIAPTPSSTAAR